MFTPKTYASITASLTKMVTDLGNLIDTHKTEQQALAQRMQALSAQNAALETEAYAAGQTKRRLEEILGIAK